MKNNIQIPTLTMQDAEELSAPRAGKKGWAVSFYLGVRADQNFLSVTNAFLPEQGKRIEANGDFSEADRRQIGKIFERMEGELRTLRLPDRARTLVLFFGARRGRIFKLPVYVPTQLVVEGDWFVHPLLKSLERYPRYVVTFLERDRARIFDLFWGEIEHRTEEIRSEVPQRMNAARATNRGVEERKIRNHIEVHINRHLEKVARATEKYMDRNRIPYLVIASRRELIERFRAFLPKRLQPRIVGSYLTRSDQDLMEIRQKSLEVIDRFERAEEERLIDRLVEGSSKKEKEAVLGVEAVLARLYDYQVHVLAIGKDFHLAGYVCPGDHHAGPLKESCPECEQEVETSIDIVDEIIETALSRKLKIVHFQFVHPAFDPYGLGAILK